MKIIDKFYGRTELAYAVVNEDITMALRLIAIETGVSEIIQLLNL